MPTTCPQCHAKGISDEARACPRCGHPLKPDIKGWANTAMNAHQSIRLEQAKEGLDRLDRRLHRIERLEEERTEIERDRDRRERIEALRREANEYLSSHKVEERIRSLAPHIGQLLQFSPSPAVPLPPSIQATVANGLASLEPMAKDLMRYRTELAALNAEHEIPEVERAHFENLTLQAMWLCHCRAAILACAAFGVFLDHAKVDMLTHYGQEFSHALNQTDNVLRNDENRKQLSAAIGRAKSLIVEPESLLEKTRGLDDFPLTAHYRETARHWMSISEPIRPSLETLQHCLEFFEFLPREDVQSMVQKSLTAPTAWKSREEFLKSANTRLKYFVQGTQGCEDLPLVESLRARATSLLEYCEGGRKKARAKLAIAAVAGLLVCLMLYSCWAFILPRQPLNKPAAIPPGQGVGQGQQAGQPSPAVSAEDETRRGAELVEKALSAQGGERKQLASEACDLLGNAAKRKDDETLHSLLGLALALRGETQKAMAEIKLAAARNPEGTEWLNRLQAIVDSLEVGDSLAVVQDLEKSRYIWPCRRAVNRDLLERIGDRYASAGNQEKAMACYDQVATQYLSIRAEGWQRVVVKLFKARVACGKFQEAVKLADIEYGAAFNTAETSLEVARAADKAGWNFQVDEWARKALRLDAASAEALFLRAKAGSCTAEEQRRLLRKARELGYQIPPEFDNATKE